MTPRVPVQPSLLRWACARRGLAPDQISHRFPKLLDWLDGSAQPTLRQLEGFAAATYTPIGTLFLHVPPAEPLPIPDMRTVGSRPLDRPSADLLDTVYLCQQRQEWYRDYARSNGDPTLAFVGSVTTSTRVEDAARAIRDALQFDARQSPTWEHAVARFVERAEDVGVLVMISGIVGTNTQRALDPEEFRGFALSDPLAPVVFINGVDSKAAQMFTLAHELAHIWAGTSALDDVSAATAPTVAAERWCNQVAAEVLVPLAELRRVLVHREDTADAVTRLCGAFKVSRLVILRRLHDAGVLDRPAMWDLYRLEVARLARRKTGDGGGNFYFSQRARVGRRFARAV